MKVLIVTVGTRGDVQLYVGLSQMLVHAGHSVTVASSKAHEKLIRAFHIGFHCIDETEDTSAIQNVVHQRGLKAINEGVRQLFDGMFKCHEKILEIAGNFDLIIGHGWLGESESEMSRKRFIRVGISENIAEKVKCRASSPAERLRIDLERFALNRVIIKPYNDFLRKINYKPIDLRTIYSKPLLLPISKVLLGSNKSWSTKSWSPGTYQSAYWYTEYESDALPNNVAPLLANGRKTVLLNFGSMTSGVKIENRSIEGFFKAAASMNCNLIWIGKHAFSDEYLSSDRFVAIEDTPLRHILPRVDVVFHHCGLGTTSEVIRSGCPSVPVPFVIDQHDWAKRLITIGSATEALSPGQLNEKHIRNRLTSVFTSETYRRNAEATRETVLQEIEADETVRRIERICES